MQKLLKAKHNRLARKGILKVPPIQPSVPWNKTNNTLLSGAFTSNHSPPPPMVSLDELLGLEAHWLKMYILLVSSIFYYNPNSIRSYKIVQKLSPKHAARGIAQSPYPTYTHGKACLPEQPPWRAAGDPRLARGRSRVRAPGPVGALRVLFFSTLPSFLLREIVFFSHLPHQTCETCG